MVVHFQINATMSLIKPTADCDVIRKLQTANSLPATTAIIQSRCNFWGIKLTRTAVKMGRAGTGSQEIEGGAWCAGWLHKLQRSRTRAFAGR